MRRYSERAKRNTRNGLNLRIKIIEERILELHKEIKTYSAYLNRGLNDRWIRRVITVVNRKIRIRKGQLRLYKIRQARLKREGKI